LVALALERAPPGSLPKRFLRLVPLWGACAGILVWQQGDVLFASRWGPGTLALVHMFTLGVFGNAMLGSLLQFMPVVANVEPRIGRRLGAALPALYNLGIVGLICGLLQWPVLRVPAAALLTVTIATYGIAALAGVRFSGRTTLLRLGLTLALVALLVTAGLGLVLALAWSGRVALPLPLLTDVHATVGLLGAALLLTGAIGSVVMPMFQGTATIPERALASWMGLLVASLLAVVVLRVLALEKLALLVLALPVLVFAGAVLLLQWRAPHQRNPTLVGFWRLGTLALLAAIAAMHWGSSRGSIVAGVLVIAVALPALIVGMLLEIRSFLAWLELQGVRERGQRVPSVHALMPESRKLRLLRLHVACALALVIAAGWPAPATGQLAAVALTASYAVLALEFILLERRTRRCALRTG
jgi:hypothetical protein